MMRRFAVILCVLLIALASSVLADLMPEQQERIAELVRQLGDADGAVRKEASRQLEEIGPDALPALAEAMESDDPEVRMRAKEIHQKLANPTPEQLQELRDTVQKAFSHGDYETMIGPARRLLAAEGTSTQDRLWLGHTYQLSGRWKDAVDAYLEVLKAMDAELKNGPKPVPVLQGGLEGFDGRRRRPMRGPVRVGVRPPDPNWHRDLIKHRTSLALWVARMQRVELKDAKGAIKTLNDALTVADRETGKIVNLWMQLLKELALAQEDAGNVRAALATWQTLHLACVEGRDGHRITGLVVMQAVDRLLGRLDPKDEAPEMTFVYLLSPDRPKAHLAPDADETRKRSYLPSGNPNSPHWKYAFAPPAGMEFDTLAFACDIEQLKARHGGHFRCFAAVPLGDIGWPNDKPLGRDVQSATFDIPPGVRMVHIETGTWKGCFNIHRIDVKATFRPATKDPAPLAPRVGAWMQTEFIPEGGKGSCGEMELQSQHAYTDVKPGKYRLRYEVPGRDDVFETDFLIEPGRRYGIFVNLDSPFRWSQAGPGGMGRYPTSGAGMAPLPGGGYLAAWSDWRQRIMLSSTNDLATWTGPAPAPFNSIFASIAPALCAANDGTVWLAFFSMRINLLEPHGPQFTLWLTSTRDGKTWTPPRPVTINEQIGTPSRPSRLVQTPDGRCWIFCRRHAASAASFEEIRELAHLKHPGDVDGLSVGHMSVAVDAAGLFHTVFTVHQRGVGYATSKDAADWSKVTYPLLPPGEGYGVSYPQLIVAGGKTLLLYEYKGARLLPIRGGAEPAKAGAGVKITNHVVPLHGSSPLITKEGEVLLLAGADTSWLLRAKLKDLLPLCEKD